MNDKIKFFLIGFVAAPVAWYTLQAINGAVTGARTAVQSAG
jgi:hypothetical protein